MQSYLRSSWKSILNFNWNTHCSLWISILARRLAFSFHTNTYLVFVNVFCKQIVLLLQGENRGYLGRYNLSCSF